jgi:trehalose 6-phosphate phosphatase
MTAPTPSEIRAHPDKWAFFLDIDGTLIDLASDPEKVLVPQGLPPLLLTLEAHFHGALALNTGRQLSVVDHMMAPTRFAAAGVHGTEMRTRHNGDIAQLAPAIPGALLTEVEAATLTLDPALKVEDKRVGLAVHFRHAPDCETKLRVALERIVSRWEQFEMRPGRKVLELVPRAQTKATAIALFLERSPFRGRLPIVIGDDVGDGPALAYAREAGGIAMTVAGEHFSQASATFADTASVRAWLQEISNSAYAPVHEVPAATARLSSSRR